MCRVKSLANRNSWCLPRDTTSRTVDPGQVGGGQRGHPELRAGQLPAGQHLVQSLAGPPDRVSFGHVIIVAAALSRSRSVAPEAGAFLLARTTEKRCRSRLVVQAPAGATYPTLAGASARIITVTQVRNGFQPSLIASSSASVSSRAVRLLDRRPGMALAGRGHVGVAAGADDDQRAVERADPRQLLELGLRLVRRERAQPSGIESTCRRRLRDRVQPGNPVGGEPGQRRRPPRADSGWARPACARRPPRTWLRTARRVRPERDALAAGPSGADDRPDRGLVGRVEQRGPESRGSGVHRGQHRIGLDTPDRTHRRRDRARPPGPPARVPISARRR